MVRGGANSQSHAAVGVADPVIKIGECNRVEMVSRREAIRSRVDTHGDKGAAARGKCPGRS